MSEIEESLQDAEKNLFNRIISSIKNTMSDKHIAQKKFNSVFQNYRASVLPNVVKNCDAMNEEIQSNLIKLNNFFVALIS